ncbi:HAD family hydrolase [Enterococcus pingfangensis]
MDVKCYGSEVKEAKPNPELFIKAASRLGISPERAYVIEDSQAGIIAANRGGFVSIYIPEGKGEFSVQGNYQCSMFADLLEFHRVSFGLDKENIRIRGFFHNFYKIRRRKSNRKFRCDLSTLLVW